MVSDSKNSLAATVLNDGKIVSYRLLSREFGVHSNVAKKMLYDFHRKQTSKKPGSVHATYLVDGVPKIANDSGSNRHVQDGEDAHMQSSPYMTSSMPQEENEENSVPTKSVILTREEDLQTVKAKFERVHSIHIYSLGPSFVQNLQILTECNRSISANYAHEDPLMIGEQYGVIQNAGVRRRNKRQLLAPSIAAVKSREKPSNNSEEFDKSNPKSTQSSEPLLSGERPGREGPQPESKPNSKPATLKREQSDIFKSFSRPKAKSKEDTGNFAPASSTPVTGHSDTKTGDEDEPMEDASEDEQEADFIANNKPNPKTGKSQSERAEDLRKMMDESDEEMKDTAEDPSPESEPIDAPKEASPEPAVVVSGGRRRGRRKVMKKKTIKDEEGYLVTKEEPVWESFSEDEPAPKERVSASGASSAVAKGKRSNGKPGQGNIMSFFGKR